MSGFKKLVCFNLGQKITPVPHLVTRIGDVMVQPSETRFNRAPIIYSMPALPHYTVLNTEMNRIMASTPENVPAKFHFWGRNLEDLDSNTLHVRVWLRHMSESNPVHYWAVFDRFHYNWSKSWELEETTQETLDRMLIRRIGKLQWCPSPYTSEEEMMEQLAAWEST